MRFQSTLRQLGLTSVVLPLLTATLLVAQPPQPASPAGQPAANPTGSIAHPPAARRHTAKPKAATPAPELPQPAPVAAEPPPPDWPVNAQAAPASVAWNGRDLSITATNSSLQQILRDVSTATGVKVEGMDKDQRIFGIYGPAPSRDVLSQLLEGAGFNLMMVGDLGEGTPRQLVLTPKAAGPNTKGAPAANPGGDPIGDTDASEEPEPEPPPVVNPRRANAMYPPPNFGPNRTPQEVMEQMQQRQQIYLNNQQQQQPALPGQTQVQPQF